MREIALRAVVFILGALLAVLLLLISRGGDLEALGLERVGNRVFHLAGRVLPGIDTPFGRVELETRMTQAGLAVKGTCRSCSISHSLIANKAFRTESALLEGTLNGTRFVGGLRLGSVGVALNSKWSGGNASGSFMLPKTSIAEVYAAAASIVPEVGRAKISGSVQGKGTFSWPDFSVHFEPTIRKFKVQGLIDADRYASGLFRHRAKDSQRREILRSSGEGSVGWIWYADMGARIRTAVVAAEDGAFFSHRGYDVGGILEAARSNEKRGKIRRGGSTITQQLAKNLFLSSERSYSRKLRELLYAVNLEETLRKRRILELYMNIAEWGPNIFGVREAAKRYFGKHPRDLSWEEAAWLASILRNPLTAYREQFLRGRPQTWRSRVVIDRIGELSEQQRESISAQKIVFATP